MKIQAEEILPKLKELIEKAKITNPQLVNKLNSLIKWIKDKPSGKIRQKKYVAAILIQLIKDVEILLKLSEFTNDEKQIFLQKLNPSQSYWFEILLPQWFIKEDKYFLIWRRKIMNDEYDDDDEIFRNVLVKLIKDSGGHSLWRYLLDLSMATDIIVNNQLKKALCVQYTVSPQRNTSNKKITWEDILRYWNIKHGIFVHVNSHNKRDNVHKLTSLCLEESDNLSDNCYSEFDII